MPFETINFAILDKWKMEMDQSEPIENCMNDNVIFSEKNINQTIMQTHRAPHLGIGRLIQMTRRNKNDLFHIWKS